MPRWYLIHVGHDDHRFRGGCKLVYMGANALGHHIPSLRFPFPCILARCEWVSGKVVVLDLVLESLKPVAVLGEK